MRTLALLPLLPACVFVTHTEELERSFDGPITAVDVQNDGGSVDVLGVDCLDCADVGAVFHWTGERPELFTMLHDDGVLEVRGECAPQIRCWVDLAVDVSSDVDAFVRTGSGGLSVTDLTGDLDLGAGSGGIVGRGGANVLAETGSGGLELEGSLGDLDLTTGSGGIVARGLEGTLARMETGSGGVEATFVHPPADVDIEAGSGGVDLTVPSGAYDLQLSTGSGSVDRAGVTDDPSSDRHLRIDTGSGGIVLQGR